MPKTDCIFCKIASNELHAVKVYEDAEFVAFLDIHPVQPGHTLVIPKAHFDRFDLTPPELVGKLFQVAHTVAQGVLGGTGAAGVNITVNSGLAAGQVVFHTHVHVIPRHAHDGLGLWPGSAYQGSEMEEVAQRIRTSLKSATA